MFNITYILRTDITVIKLLLLQHLIGV